MTESHRDHDDSRYPVPINDELRALLGEELPKVEAAIRQAQVDMILGRTPEYAKKYRVIRGGQSAPYVPHSWVEMQLNLIFGWRWSAQVIREMLGQRQVWVYLELKVCVGGEWLTKCAYGGAEIKRYSQDVMDTRTKEVKYKKGDVISLRDDLEAAKSLAITKAARLFGISADVGATREEMEAIFDEEVQQELVKDIF